MGNLSDTVYLKRGGHQSVDIFVNKGLRFSRSLTKLFRYENIIPNVNPEVLYGEMKKSFIL